MAHKRSARRKLSPAQLLKGTLIRIGLARRVKAREGKVVFRLLWGRIGAVALCLAFTGWLSLATGAYFFVKHKRQFSEVRFVDIVLPTRWDELRTAWGDYYIATAQEMLKSGERGNLLHLVRVGVQKSPDNTEGRLMLAQFYNSIGRPDMGIALLEKRALEHAEDVEYVTTLIGLMFNNMNDAAVDELATQILGESKEVTQRNLVVALAAATANFHRGQYDRAEQFINDFGLLNSRSGTLLQARIEWETGEWDRAISRLDELLRQREPTEEVANFLIDYLWKAGRKAKAQQIAFDLFIKDPLSHGPRLRLLGLYHKMGETDRETEELASFFQLFRRDESAMRDLAALAGQTGRPRLAERVFNHVREQGLSSGAPVTFLMEAYVRAGEHRQALELFESLEDEIAEWTPRQQATLRPIVATAHFGLGNMERAQATFREVMAETDIHAATLISFAQKLVDLGEHSRARTVLQHVYSAQPLNQQALTRLIRLDIETGNHSQMARNLNRLLGMRNPSIPVLEQAHRHIRSDLFLFETDRAEILQTLENALVTAGPRRS